MGFTALDGLPMGTRCGQLDPGVLLYLMQAKSMDADELTDLLYRQSGLKGLSGVSHDMRALEQADTPEARDAIDYFVFRIRRELGGLTAALGGLDALVFTDGIGENAWRVRAGVLTGMEWLGIVLDSAANARSHQTISAASSRVRVLVLRTDEEERDRIAHDGDRPRTLVGSSLGMTRGAIMKFIKSTISCADAAAMIPEGASLLIGGFMGVGTPNRLIDALVAAGKGGLTVIANDTAKAGVGIGKLISADLVARVVDLPHRPQSRDPAQDDGRHPRGRAGAAGHARGAHPRRRLWARRRADQDRARDARRRGPARHRDRRRGMALCAADPRRFRADPCDRADYNGNLAYQLTSTNFNPVMAMAGDVVICEPREIVPTGLIPPDAVTTPGVVVNHLIARAA